MCVKHQVILPSFWDWDFLWGSPTPLSGPDIWYYMKNKATEILVIISSLLSPPLMWHSIQHHYHPYCYLLFCVYICFGKKNLLPGDELFWTANSPIELEGNIIHCQQMPLPDPWYILDRRKGTLSLSFQIL